LRIFYISFKLNVNIAEGTAKSGDSAPSDRDQYRRAPAEGDKKGEAGAGSYEFVSNSIFIY
jgi:hypothetical protein